MRAKVFLLKASGVLLSVFLICGKAAPIAYCQDIFNGVTSVKPEFITTMVMDLHQKAAVIIDLIDPIKNTLLSSGAPRTDDKKTSLELINFILKKNSPGEKKDTPAVAESATPAPVADSLTLSPTQLASVQVRESAAPEVVEGEKTATEDPAPTTIEEEVDPIINKYAEMISVEPQDISNYPLYRFIDHWYGTRYKWGGMTNKGIDCSAFSQKLYSEIYGEDLARTSREQHRECERIKDYNDASEGDLIFFRIHRIRISHVGVYLANGYFVHASRSHGVMISSLSDKYWHRRYAGCGKIEKEEKLSESDYMQ